MNARRVAVTGLGVISAVGRNLRQIWEALSSGRSGITPILSVDVSSLRFQYVAEVQNYDPARHFSPNKLNLLDRFAQLAVIAAREALLDSGIVLTEELRERTAVFCGTSMGGQVTRDASFADLYRRGRYRVHHLAIARIMASGGCNWRPAGRYAEIHFDQTAVILLARRVVSFLTPECQRAQA